MVKPKDIQQAEETRLQGVIPELCNGFRLDKALATLFDQYSRSAIQHWIKDGLVTLDGKTQGQKTKVKEGQSGVIHVPAPVATDSQAQDILLDIPTNNFRSLISSDFTCDITTHHSFMNT